MAKSRKAKNVLGISDAPYQASDLINIHESHISYFDELWQRGAENELYRTGKNLSEKQEEDYYKQDRIPFPNAITADKLNRIISTERNSRTSAKAEATEPNSEIKAEMLTMRFKKIEKDSNLEYTESEIFESGVAAIYGVGKIKVDYDRQGNRIIKVVDVDYRNCIWDSNARLYDKSDGAFMAERKAVYRRDIRRDYGDKIADGISINHQYFGRPVEQYWGIEDRYGRRDNDIIFLFEHYHKTLRDYWYIVWEGRVVHKETKKQDAEEMLRMLKIPYLRQGLPLPVCSVEKHTVLGYDKYIFVYDAILEYEQTDLETFPYCVYQAFNFKEKIWCMTDILKPKNKFMDKLISQVDAAFGKDLKDAWEIVEPWLAAGVSIEEAQRMLKNGIPVPVIRPGVIKSVTPKGVNPQWLQVYEMLKQDITDYAGGALFSGNQVPGHREAQLTVAMKMRQQELVATYFIDNLRRWKRDLFTKLIWWIKKYDNEEIIIKTEGGNLSPQMIQILIQNGIYQESENNPGVGYLKLNQENNKLSWLDDVEANVIITESELSETMREAKQNELERWNQMYPGSVPIEVALEYSDMEYSLKQKMIEANKAVQQNALMQQQNQQNLEQDKANTDKAKVLAQTMRKT